MIKNEIYNDYCDNIVTKDEIKLYWCILNVLIILVIRNKFTIILIDAEYYKIVNADNMIRNLGSNIGIWLKYDILAYIKYMFNYSFLLSFILYINNYNIIISYYS